MICINLVECNLQNGFDEELLVSLSDDKREENNIDHLLFSKSNSNKNISSKIGEVKRANIKSYSETKRFYDDKFQK